MKTYTSQFEELHKLCALNESSTHDLAHYIRGLRPNRWENMNYCPKIQEAYAEALHVEQI